MFIYQSMWGERLDIEKTMSSNKIAAGSDMQKTKQNPATLLLYKVASIER